MSKQEINPKEEVIAKGIEALDLSTRSFKVLYHNGICTIQELQEMTDKEIKSLRGIGQINLKEIKERLAVYGERLAHHESEKLIHSDKNPHSKQKK